MRVAAILSTPLLLLVHGLLVESFVHRPVEVRTATSIGDILFLLHDLARTVRHLRFLLNFGDCAAVSKSVVHLSLPATIIVGERHIQVRQVFLCHIELHRRGIMKILRCLLVYWLRMEGIIVDRHGVMISLSIILLRIVLSLHVILTLAMLALLMSVAILVLTHLVDVSSDLFSKQVKKLWPDRVPGVEG